MFSWAGQTKMEFHRYFTGQKKVAQSFTPMLLTAEAFHEYVSFFFILQRKRKY